MFFEKKVIEKIFKPKDSKICVYRKEKKVIVRHFKRKISIEIFFLKRRLLWNVLNVKIPTNVFIKKKGYGETF